MAKLPNTAVIGISESKLGNFMPTSEIEINKYDVLCCDRNRHGDEVYCQIIIYLS